MPSAYLQLEPRKAFRATRALLADPNDLPQVFTIINSLSADTLSRIYRRMMRTESGARVLAARPDIVTLLGDREALRRLPEGTVGRAYLAFVEAEGISAEGIREAGEKGTPPRHPVPAPYDYVHERMRDTHDLWHAVTGYQGDVLGEVSLLGFSLAQTWNPGIALIVAAGLSKTHGDSVARSVIFDGFRRGRRAVWLPAIEWETMLAMPLEEARRVLRLESPPDYVPVRAAEYNAANNAAATTH